jgi:vitamin B12 transporter
MRSRYWLFAVLVFSLSALAELNVKVVDPQSAAVSGAQVELFAGNSTRPAAVQTTSPRGIAHFQDATSASIRVHVLAAGFAEEWKTLSHSAAEVTIALRVALKTETVVVTATRTPSRSDKSGAAIESLSGAELETMRPVAANDALRFLPGAVVATAGQRGGLGSLFVRGGDSRYNKVIVDGVSVNDPGGTFDFGTLPLFEEDRLEFLRGAQSTLYGSDAMTSVVQVWSRTGNTPVPELRFGADAGNFGTENGYASLSGANGRFDYNVFGNQFNTSGSGPNDDYSNSLEGANLGTRLTDWASLRLRARHDNSVSGVPGAWNYNGTNVFDVNGTPTALLPDLDQRARQNNLLGSLELVLIGPSHWQHRLNGFDYTLRRRNSDFVSQAGRLDAFGDNLDGPFEAVTRVNRAGVDYQGSYAERSWAVSTIGYEFEDENGTVGDLLSNSLSHGVWRNQAVFGDQTLTFGRASLLAGGRFVHNQSFGNKFVPRVALTMLVQRGRQVFSGTRLHFTYGTGIKEPSFSESFGNGGGFPILPNPSLKPEETRAFDVGFEQSLLSRYSFSAAYFNNLFRNKIDFNLDPCFCTGQYVNVNEALAHGAEVVFNGKPSSHVSLGLAYTYTSTQVLKEPFAFDPLLSAGQPLIRRPRHSATAVISYLGSRRGGDLTGSFVGRRADSDFLGFGINHAPGYLLVNAGGWYAIRRRVTVYLNLENLLDRSYQEVTGYPALGINFRAGIRFRVGGE